VRRLLSTIMLIAAAGTLVPAAAGTASAAIRPDTQRFGVRLVDVPVSEAHNPRALRYIIDYVRPGTVLRRRILVVSSESRRAHLTVYPDAATIIKGYFIGDAAATRSELTTWIKIQHPVLNLRPGARSLDLVTIRVPRIATRGEHYGVIWVQQEAHARTASGVGVNEISRVGIRIYLAVGKGGAPPTRFDITSISGVKHGSRPLIVAHVRNTGGRAVDVAGTARLTGGPGGVTAGPFSNQQVVTLAPGQSGDVVFAPSRQLPEGAWQATVSLVSGLNRVRSTAGIQLGAGPGGASWTGLVAMLGGIGVILLIVAMTFILARRSLRTRRLPA
jgi:hypothetical protein